MQHSKKPVHSPPSPSNVTSADDPDIRKILALFHSGNYQAAMIHAETSINNPNIQTSTKAWIKRQLPNIKTSWAWFLMQTGKCDDAIIFFEQSLKSSQSAEAIKGLAICQFKLRKVDEAEESFQRYLELNPNDHQIGYLYTDVLESQGKYREAIEIIEQLEKQNPLLSRRKSNLENKYEESHSQSRLSDQLFTLTWNIDIHEDIANLILEELHAAAMHLQNHFGMELPTSNIEVILYGREVFDSVVPYSPKWATALYDGRIRIPINNSNYNIKKLRKTLRHELFHAFLAEQVDRRKIPTWFNEGLAQLAECINSCAPFNFPPTPSIFLSRQDLEESWTKLDKTKANLAYRQSYYIILFLVSELAKQKDITSEENTSGEGLINRLGRSSRLDSDSLLEEVPITFKKLHELAQASWDKRLTIHH